MKSFLIVIHLTSLKMMILLFLLSITGPTASSSSLSNDSLGSVVNESIQLVLGTTFKPSDNNQQLSLVIGEEISPASLGSSINTFIGFASSVIGIYQFFDSVFNPGTPQGTVNDVLNKMDTEFTLVKRDLNVIKDMLNKQELYRYGEVEAAVNSFINDLKHSSPVDIPSRAVRLYDQLDIFMKGLLGETTGLFPDLLVAVRNVYDVSFKLCFIIILF